MTSGGVADLRRGIGFSTLTALIVNSMIGAGVMGLPGAVYALAGKQIYLAVAGAALVAASVALCLAQLARGYDRTGGPIIYIGDVLGPLAAFVTGCLLWLGTIMSAASLLNLLGQSIRALVTWHISVIWIIAAVGVLLASITLAGIRQSALVNNILTVSKVILLIMISAVGLSFGHSEVALPQASATDIGAAVVLMFFAFVGFERPTTLGAEIRNPDRNLPIALLVALSLVAILYFVVMAACIAAVPGLASEPTPLAAIAGRSFGRTGLGAVNAAAVIMIGGTLLTMWLIAPRMLFAMAEVGDLPRCIAQVDKRGTPRVAIVITTACAIGLATVGSFSTLLAASSSARLIIFAGCAIALLIRSWSSGKVVSSAIAVTTFVIVSTFLCLGAPKALLSLAIAMAVTVLLRIMLKHLLALVTR